MNSLNDLNNYSIEVTYSDDRAPFVEFDKTTPDNQSQVINEGETIIASLGIEILDIVGYASTLVNYTIDVSAVAGTIVTWPTIPPGCTVTNPSTDVYRISGINSQAIWDQIKYPIIITPADYTGSFNYTSTINYFTTLDKTWTTTLAITNVIEWSTTNPADFYFVPNSANSIVGAPTLTDVGNPTPSWIITVTPSNPNYVTTMSTTGTGGSSSFNATTKVLTVTGTNAQINSRLSTLSITTISGVEDSFTLTYRATNIQYGFSDSVIQTLRSTLIRYLSKVGANQVYAEDTPALELTNTSPLVTDLENTSGGNYTVTVGPEFLGAVTIISSAGTGGSTTWNNVAKVYTITGTKAQVNSHLTSLTVTIAADYTTDFNLTYVVTTPGTFTQTKNQFFDNVAVHPEVQNITLTRDYVPATTTSIFATNTPVLSDLDSVPNFTITLTCTKGVFNAPGTTSSSNWTYTGTKAQINALFSQITFTPNSGIDTSDTATYTQSKNATVYVTETFTLLGPIATNAGNFVYYSGTTQTITGVPTVYNEDPGTTSWTVTLTPNKTSVFGTLSSLGSGGTTNFNTTSKVYTIIGTKTQVNSHLNSLRLNSVLGQDLDFTLTYVFTNNLSQTQSRIQNLTSNNYTVLDSVRNSDTYQVNTITTISGGSQITDTVNPSTATYTMQVTSVPGSAISNIQLDDPNAIRTFANKGQSTSLTNEYFAVGDETAGTYGSGKVYIYNIVTGNLIYTLINPDPNSGTVIYNQYGICVKIVGSYVFVGSPNRSSGAGTGLDRSRVYVYSLLNGNLITTIQSPNATADDFGFSIDASSTNLYIGAFGSATGRVYVYSLSNWNQTATIQNPLSGDATVGILDRFGYAIAVNESNNQIIVGAPGEDETTSGEGVDQGSVHVFNLTNNALIRTLTNPSATPGTDNFGFTIGVNSTYTVIGTGDVNSSELGKVYIFNNSTGSLVRTITASILDQRFGDKIEVNSTYVLVRGNAALPNSKAYLYNLSTGELVYTFNSTVSDFTASLSGSYAVVDSVLYEINVTTSWNPTTSTYTIIGSKVLINGKIDALLITPSTGYVDNFELYYKVTTPSSAIATRNQFINKV